MERYETRLGQDSTDGTRARRQREDNLQLDKCGEVVHASAGVCKSARCIRGLVRATLPKKDVLVTTCSSRY